MDQGRPRNGAGGLVTSADYSADLRLNALADGVGVTGHQDLLCGVDFCLMASRPCPDTQAPTREREAEAAGP